MTYKFAYVIFFLYLCGRKGLNKNFESMLATPVRENGSQPMLGNYENEVYYTRGEFMDELAKQLGQAYGLNDIREAR